MASYETLLQQAHRRVGDTLGKYRLLDVLGVGGMASVFLAEHRNGLQVAIKILRRELSVDDDIRNRFIREGYTANSVGHRGVVRVLDDDITEDASVYLVMELLHGTTVSERARLAGGRLPLAEVASMGVQLLDVLVAAHEVGIIHRDIKPDNLFWTDEGVLKVLDFGIARMSTAGLSATATGRTLGTPAFMPPEQALGRSKQVNATSDLWSVGASLFFLLSGRVVHIADTMEETLVKAALDPALPLAQVAPETPEAICAVIDRALAFEQAKRWPDARSMQQALAAAAGISIAPRSQNDSYTRPRSSEIAATLDAPSVTPAPGRASSPVVHTLKAAIEATPAGRVPSKPSLPEIMISPREARRSEPELLPAPPQASKSQPELRPLSGETMLSPGVQPVAFSVALEDMEPSRRSGSSVNVSSSAETTGQEHPQHPASHSSQVASVTASPRSRGRLERLAILGGIALLATLGAWLRWGLSSRWGGSPDAHPTSTSSGNAALSATAPGCTSMAECSARMPGFTTRCILERCVALETPQCHLLADDTTRLDEDTVWLGSMFPVSDLHDQIGGPSERALDLARSDFMRVANGLPPLKPGGKSRPIGVVSCDDRGDFTAVAHHLIDDLHVPAVIGFGTSKEAMDLATQVFQPKKVLAFASNLATMLSQLPHAAGEPRMLYRVTSSAASFVDAMAALVSDTLEPTLQRAGHISDARPMKVALVVFDNTTGISFRDLFLARLKVQQRPISEHLSYFHEEILPEHPHPLPEEIAHAVDGLVAFLPDVVINLATDASMIRALEARWPKGSQRPFYVNLGTMYHYTVLGTELPAELRTRIIGIDNSIENPTLGQFVFDYNQRYTPQISAIDATSSPYDAFYLTAYLVAAVGSTPLSGESLARALPRLMAKEPVIQVGASSIYQAFNQLQQGHSFKLAGTVTALDFNWETGDSPADFETYCITSVNGSSLTESTPSGLHFSAKEPHWIGSLHCPR